MFLPDGLNIADGICTSEHLEMLMHDLKNMFNLGMTTKGTCLNWNLIGRYQCKMVLLSHRNSGSVIWRIIIVHYWDLFYSAQKIFVYMYICHKVAWIERLYVHHASKSEMMNGFHSLMPHSQKKLLNAMVGCTEIWGNMSTIMCDCTINVKCNTIIMYNAFIIIAMK